MRALLCRNLKIKLIGWVIILCTLVLAMTAEDLEEKMFLNFKAQVCYYCAHTRTLTIPLYWYITKVCVCMNGQLYPPTDTHKHFSWRVVVVVRNNQVTKNMAEEKYNRKNPSVKRILQEFKEMQSNPSDDFMSLPLEENIFEWQFAIRGPSETEFEGGIYHGRIQLPSEYPFKPPSFMLLTPNGRFETQTKICLSISNHHPEHWQPSWSVRTALTALIAFMPTNPNGALGSLDYKKEERRILAIKSREYAPKFGNPERQKLIDEIHAYMLSKIPPVPELGSAQNAEEHSTDGEENPQLVDVQSASEEPHNPAVDNRIVEQQDEAPLGANPTPDRMVVARQVTTGNPSEQHQLLQRPETRVQRSGDDRLFTLAAVGLTIAIAFLLLKKFLKASEFGTFFMDGS